MIGRRKKRVEEAQSVEPKGFDDFDLRLGDMMRGERATLGKSLLDVQRELKIKASYISAIENCDPNAFETPGFIAGYVRSYARYLNMDPDKTFALFCNESGFSTAHGMSEEASSIKKSRAAEVIASSPAGRDPFAQPSTPFVPTGDGFMARVEPGAIGSTLVLVALLGAIGFGGYTVLNEVQRVSVAPVEQAPVVLTDLDPVQSGNTAAQPIGAATTNVITDPVAALTRPESDGLDRLYRPKALDTPVLVARDAPISTLDPRRMGAFASAPSAAPVEPAPLQTADVAPEFTFDTDSVVAAAMPQVFEQAPGDVQLVAVREAWVRVRGVDGTTVFEGIMQPCDTFRLPVTEDAPTMRVGDAGAIFFAANGTHYGPVGSRGQVTSGVVLSADSLSQTYAVADLTGDNELARRVADASGGAAGLTYSCK